MKIEKMSVKCLALCIPHSPSEGGQMIYVKSLVKLVLSKSKLFSLSALVTADGLLSLFQAQFANL